ncbi:YcaO-like family protein [Aquibium sp. LZ166]|uniref:YcaO-like family protein n=1 Tax=Aquibium pacificus TaxID=3153579 RepID=A0ABV3SLC7_9HYPH
MIDIEAAIGVTRIGDLTGYDRIGIPVAMAVRPLSRGYCVAQGKALTFAGARSSALMEAAEGYHGENIDRPLHYASYAELKDAGAVDPQLLPRVRGRIVGAYERFLWIRGQTLSGDAALVPFECVHTDYSLPSRASPGVFLCSSNGLGAGRSFADSGLHALLEVLERDAEAVFRAAGLWTDMKWRVAFDALPEGDASRVVERLRSVDIEPHAWNITSDLGVPAIYVTLVDKREPLHSPVKLVSGSACREGGEAALLAALLEAIQTRATVIAGTRDDLYFDHYLDIDTQLVSAKLHLLETSVAGSVLPSSCNASIDALGGLVEEALGCSIVVVDLSLGICGVHVVRVIVPGAEGVPGHSEYARGVRARIAARKQ